MAVAVLGWRSSISDGQERRLVELTPEELATKYVDDFCAWKAAEAEADLWKKYTERLRGDSLNREQFAEGERLDSATLDDLTALVSNTVHLFDSQLEAVRSTLAGESLPEFCGGWREIRKQRNSLDVLRAESLTSQPAGMLVALVGKDVRWFWLAGLFAFASLAGVSFHYFRHEFRRALFGAKARNFRLTRILIWASTVAAVATTMAFFGAEPLMRHLTVKPPGLAFRSQARMVEEAREVGAHRQAAEAQLKATVAECTPKWQRWLQGEKSASLRGQWRRDYQMVLECNAVATLNREIMAELKNDATVLAELNKTLEENDRLVQRPGRRQWAVTFGIGVLGTVLVVAFLLLASILRRERAIKETCPICLGRSTLKRERDETDVRIRNAPPMVHCTNLIPDYGPCPFSFPAEYQDRGRVCFPTIGVPSSGRTHWLSMLYHEMSAGRYSGDVRLTNLQCESSRHFDELVATLLQQRVVGTIPPDSLPIPLIFDFTDHDPWGQSNVLVSVFDYSGEVSKGSNTGFKDAQRRRALRADGFLYFLDPTKAPDSQHEALSMFRRDVRQVQRRLNMQSPIAICVTKIDLLTGSVPRPFVEYFYEQLRAIDPTGKSMSMDVIRARSQLTQELRRELWPDWEVERFILDLFGGRQMFFPLTPVGFDLPGSSSRWAHSPVIHPFGIIEPLLWLLHMNGYRTLTEGKRNA